MKKITSLALILFFFFSCSTEKKKKDSQNNYVVPYMGVEHKLLPQVDSGDSYVVDSYGPAPHSLSYNSQKISSNVPIMGVFLGPCLYRAIKHVQVIKHLQNSGVVINVISGVGLGGVVAALFAKGMRPNEIEWLLFKFYKSVESIRPFSDEWRDKLDEILLSSIPDQFTIESLRLSFFIPLFSPKDDNIKIVKKGNLKKSILESLRLISKRNEFSSSLAIMWNVKKSFKQMGADLVSAIDVIGNDKIFLNSANGFLAGVYGRASSNQERYVKNFDLKISLGFSNLALDEVNNLPELNKKDWDEIKSYLNKYKEFYHVNNLKN